MKQVFFVVTLLPFLLAVMPALAAGPACDVTLASRGEALRVRPLGQENQPAPDERTPLHEGLLSPDGSSYLCHFDDGASGPSLSLASLPDGKRVGLAGWDDVAINPLFAFSADGKQVVAVTTSLSEEGTDVKRWSVPSGTALPVVTVPGHGAPAELSPDGRWLLLTEREARSRRRVPVVASTETGAIARRLSPHDEELRYQAFSSDGRLVATTSGANGVYRVERVSDGKVLVSAEAGEKVDGFSFSPDGKLVFLHTRKKKARVHDTDTGTVIWDEVNVWHGGFSPVSNELGVLLKGDRFHLVDPRSGKTRGTVSLLLGRLELELFRWSAEGKEILFLLNDHRILALSAETGEPRFELAPVDGVPVAEIWAAGNTLAVQYHTDWTRVWWRDSLAGSPPLLGPGRAGRATVGLSDPTVFFAVETFAEGTFRVQAFPKR